MTLGEKIKHLRKINDLNQKEFSTRIGVSQGTLSDIERGICSPSYETLQAIRKSFKCDLNWLMNDFENINSVSSLSLTKEEQSLLKIFRSLPTEEKNELFEIARMKQKKYIR